MMHVSLALAVLAIALPQLAGTTRPNLDGRSFPVSAGTIVELRDIPGPVYVTAGNTRSISVRIARTAISTEADLPQLRVDQLADRVAIYGTPVATDDGRRIELHLSVPASVRLDIQRVKGELRVTGGLEGALSASDVAGAIQATVRDVEAVRIANVSGSVRLSVDADRGRRNIEIDRVSGAIAVVRR